MGVVTRADSPFYQLNLERGKGQRCIRRSTTIHHTTGTKEQDAENYRLALAEYHQRMADLTKGRLDIPIEPGESSAPTLKTFLDDQYRDWLRREHPTSAEQAIGRLDRHFLPIFGDTPIDRISKAAIELWRKKRRKDGVSAHTIGRDLSDLRGLLTNAVDPLEVISASPLAEMRTKAAPSREIIRYLDRKEEGRLFRALKDRDSDGIAARERFNAWRKDRVKPPLSVPAHYKDSLTPMVTVALNTGVRPAELFRLTWAAIDWKARDLVVNWWVSKTKKTRHIALNADAMKALKQWREQAAGTPAALIFPGKGGKPYTGAPKSWDELISSTKIPAFRFQDLRHTFASKLVQRGINLYVVQRLIGHASIKTTERYAHLAPSQGRQAVNVLRRRTTTPYTRSA